MYLESEKFVSGIRKSKRIPQTKWIHSSVFTELANKQLKARAGFLIYSNAGFKVKVLTIVSGIHEQISKHFIC